MTPSKEDPYFIEVDTIGCTHCGHGQSWNVIGPDGAAFGMSYTNEEDAAELADMLNEAFGRGATDRDRLAERVRELEHWIDKGESPMLKTVRKQLVTAEAEVSRLKNVIYPKFELEGDEPRPPLSTEELWYVIREKQSALIGHGETIDALAQRVAGLEEGFNELVKSYHAMQQTAMKLFDRLDANGLIGADGAERHALLQEISPVDAITSEDIAKAQQALEGK